ncbi:Uncharacterised protein [Enterobacter hormaechei]|nr:Uncharacterised protein [Enterobacter hormaechei]VAX73430.1 Uncharacterised protein [Enterobacter cloacae]
MKKPFSDEQIIIIIRDDSQRGVMVQRVYVQIRLFRKLGFHRS